MQGRIGTATTRQAVLPGAPRLGTIVGVSQAARLRLKWMDYYRLYPNAALVCRHFGLTRSLFYKWQKRYRLQGVRGLEDQSTCPKRQRTPTTEPAQIDLVCSLRRQNPEYSKYKLAVILERDHGLKLSASTVGRIINKHQLFFTPPVKPTRHPDRLRKRRPKDMTVNRPGDLIEVDVKHLPLMGVTRYGFVAIDIISKQAFIHVATTISSRQAAIAWQKVCTAWDIQPKAVLGDNGTENLGAFAKLLEEMAIPQYFARPRTPKDKPYVERFIGSLERECIQWGGLTIDLADQQQVIDTWLEKYHTYRPHQALNYLTPRAYAAKLKANQPTELSTML